MEVEKKPITPIEIEEQFQMEDSFPSLDVSASEEEDKPDDKHKTHKIKKRKEWIPLLFIFLYNTLDYHG